MGTTLSSTSIGTAVQMLQGAGFLESFLGQLIAAAAIIDDVLSLVILGVVQNLASSKSENDDADAPLVLSIGQPIGVALLLALCLFLAMRWGVGTKLLHAPSCHRWCPSPRNSSQDDISAENDALLPLGVVSFVFLLSCFGKVCSS